MCAGPHPALRRVLAVDAAAVLAILAEALAGWDALASDLATAAALGPAPSGAQACSATQVRPLLLHPITQSSSCPAAALIATTSWICHSFPCLLHATCRFVSHHVMMSRSQISEVLLAHILVVWKF